MAKKKTKKVNENVNKITAKEVKKDESMLANVEVKSPIDQEKVSKIVGTVFIVLGLLLIGYGVFSFVKYSRNPEFDQSLQAPSLTGTSVLTNEENITIKGLADGYNEVFVYVDNKEVGRVKVGKEGEFEYKYKVDQEGKYAVSVAGVKGFPKRHISPQSDMRVVTVDRTAPKLDSLNYASEVGTKTFTLAGKAEVGSEVVLKRGTSSYSAKSDENGDFEIKGISLDEGPNVYNVEIKDEAGNIAYSDEKVKVTYSVESDVNGDAVYDENGLPVASGNLEDALNEIFRNNLMLVFGFLALASFAVSTGIVINKSKKVA
ncbi:hypothetical protein GYA44_00795 [Candidatus Microgenomates bacterium]|nr:hypothetical protein [Candidatus Microgenomates bacterium]